MDPYVFTMDLEWSPAAVVEEALRIFDERGIRCTLFATNPMDDLSFGRHEVAIHPHCKDLNDLAGPLDGLMGAFPGVEGVRWHALFASQWLYPLYAARGIRYESNVLMQNQEGIRPFLLLPDLWQVPIFFMDNMHLRFASRDPTFDLDALALGGSGLRVFDFHPIHLFLNTEAMAQYERAKPDYHDPDRLRRHVNDATTTGVRVLLERLLDCVEREGIPTLTVMEALEAHLNGATEWDP